MRLAYLTGRYPTISHTFILQEVRALRARGIEVDTFSIWRTDTAELLTPADREEAARTFSVLPLRPLAVLSAHAIALARSPSGYLAALRLSLGLAVPGVRGRLLGVSWFVEAITLWQTMARRGITHVHAHLNGTAPTVALVIARFGRATGLPWTWSMTVHGPSEFYDVARECLPRKLREATFVVAISDFARSQLLGLVDVEHHAKIHVVHCGVDPAAFDANPAPDAEDLDRPLHVLCVSRLTRVKGHAVLLGAIAQLVDQAVQVRATVVGDGPMRGALERLAAELGVDDRVVFTGAVGHDMIRAHYAAADVFCLTSFAEGVPVVLMEAMAMRLPVVASQVMGVSELVEDGESGILVRPARPDLVADALRRLQASPDLGRRMGAAGQKAVRREFDVHDSAGQLAQLFSAYTAR
jgi:colanic acid/amylovoran biosynthesis glycosyltransferase